MARSTSESPEMGGASPATTGATQIAEEPASLRHQQLRREDVHEHEGVWCMRFAAEAGSLKNSNSERAVPLDPALIENGLLAFIQTVKAGPLFAKLPPTNSASAVGTGRT